MQATTTASPRNRNGPTALTTTRALRAISISDSGRDTSASTMVMSSTKFVSLRTRSITSSSFVRSRPAIANVTGALSPARDAIARAVATVIHAPVKPLAPKMHMSARILQTIYRQAVARKSSLELMSKTCCCYSTGFCNH